MSEMRDDTEYASFAEYHNHRPWCNARGWNSLAPHRCTCDAPPPRTPEVEAKIAELEARILSPALTRDEAARRLTNQALDDASCDGRYSFMRETILTALYGPPVETPTPEGQRP